MQHKYASIYLTLFAKERNVKLYESDGEVLFPIVIKVDDKTVPVKDAYIYYLINDDNGLHKYGVQLFIDEVMTYFTLQRIFSTSISIFEEKLYLEKINVRANNDSDVLEQRIRQIPEHFPQK